ncbi:MAG: hypothetical protein J6Z38_06875 [Lachnospiraceae bacterium]|nr:hypothetical protein [Lachnospiraceae bacterium]
MKFFLRAGAVLKSFYGKYNPYLDGLLRFLFAMLSFMTVFFHTGYNQVISNPVIAVLLAVVCAFLPVTAVPVLTCTLLVIEFLSVSVEVAAIACVILAMMVLLYFIFKAGDSWIMTLTMLVCLWGVPALALPVALVISPLQVLVAVFGCVLYGLIIVVKKDISVLSAQTGSLTLLGRVNLLLTDLFTHQRFLLVLAVLAASLIVIAFIRRAKFNHAGAFAMAVGIFIFIVSYMGGCYLLELSVNYVLLAVSLAGAGLCAFVMLYMIRNFDFKRTEEVQFEDDEYFYFVKAVPKATIPVTKKKEEVITQTKLDTFSVDDEKLFRRHKDEQKGEENG